MQNKVLFHFREGFVHMSAGAKVLLLFAIGFFSVLIFTILAIFLAVPIFGTSFNNILAGITDPGANNLGLIRYFQIIQTVCLFILPALICAWLFSFNTFAYLHADHHPRRFTVLLVMLTLVMAIPLLNAMAWLNSYLTLPGWMSGLENKMKHWEESADRLTELFLVGGSTGAFLVNFVMIAILPAIGEEFIFRGVLQRLFSEMTRNAHAGIWISAFLFSFIHFQFYGFLPRLMLGVYFGYLLYWSGSIWVPVIGHFINNGFAVIYYHFSAQPMNSTAMDQLGVEKGYRLWLYISVFATAALILSTYRNEKGRFRSIT